MKSKTEYVLLVHDFLFGAGKTNRWRFHSWFMIGFPFIIEKDFFYILLIKNQCLSNLLLFILQKIKRNKSSYPSKWLEKNI